MNGAGVRGIGLDNRIFFRWFRYFPSSPEEMSSVRTRSYRTTETCVRQVEGAGHFGVISLCLLVSSGSCRLAGWNCSSKAGQHWLWGLLRELEEGEGNERLPSVEMRFGTPWNTAAINVLGTSQILSRPKVASNTGTSEWMMRRRKAEFRGPRCKWTTAL